MLYIGIDQSFSGTGVCVIDQSGEIISSQKLPPHPVGAAGVAAIVEACNEYKFFNFLGPDLEVRAFVVELPAISKGASQAYQELCALFGALRYSLAAEVVNPRSWQSKIMKNTLAKMNKRTKDGKLEYLHAVYRATGYTFDDTDIADAFCIAEYQRRLDLGMVEPPKKRKLPKIHRARKR